MLQDLLVQVFSKVQCALVVKDISLAESLHSARSEVLHELLLWLDHVQLLLLLLLFGLLVQLFGLVEGLLLG